MGTTRRQFLLRSAQLGAAGALVGVWPGSVFAPRTAQAFAPAFFSTDQWAALQAALERVIPAEGPGDWSAADVGAGEYIDTLLSSFDDAGEPVAPRIYAGGPFRPDFGSFQPLSRVKQIGWGQEVARLRGVYREGLAELDRRAGGDFGGRFTLAPAATQEMILLSLDYEGSDFFDALYHHTMEGVYGHPVYGGNRDYLAWETFCYQGDVHGVRFPDQLNPPGSVSAGAWNQFGGYAPEEMIQPGRCPGQGPVKP